MSTTLQMHPVGLTWFERSGMSRAAHAVRANDRVWLIDPFENEEGLKAAAELGAPAGVIQLLDRHNRDCQAIADRLGVPHVKLPSEIPDSPFTVVPVITRPWWKEIALWWPGGHTLIVAEAVGTAPLFALGRTAGVHPMLRLRPPRRALGEHRPQRLLVGHGPALETGGDEALQAALAASRSDVPKLVVSLPRVLRGG